MLSWGPKQMHGHLTRRGTCRLQGLVRDGLHDYGIGSKLPALQVTKCALAWIDGSIGVSISVCRCVPARQPRKDVMAVHGCVRVRSTLLWRMHRYLSQSLLGTRPLNDHDREHIMLLPAGTVSVKGIHLRRHRWWR